MKILKRSEHPISRRRIDSGALRVLNRLYRSGFTAYLVGGSVRDLFLKREPKDFDVVTSARPTQVRKLFRNCRLIGRRFRLAHVHFSGSEIVEVATFRCQPEAKDDDLLLVSDNRFGSPEEDAYRRDFTINGLFYDIADFSVIDYVGGVSDIEKRIVRTINDPWTRFQEDPVRMTRAIKFAAKLDFEIEENTWKALCESSETILRSPPPRVQEEIARLLEEGASCSAIGLLYDSGLLRHLEPNLDAYLSSDDRRHEWDEDGEFLFDLLAQVDLMYADGVKFSRAVLFSLWLLPFLLEKKFFTAPSPDNLVRKLGEEILPSVGVSRRDLERLGQILLALRRFVQSEKKSKKSAPRAFLARSYLPEALLLYKLFLEATDGDVSHLDWWRDQCETAQSQRKSRDSTGGSGPKKNRQGRFRKRRSS